MYKDSKCDIIWKPNNDRETQKIQARMIWGDIVVAGVGRDENILHINYNIANQTQKGQHQAVYSYRKEITRESAAEANTI